MVGDTIVCFCKLSHICSYSADLIGNFLSAQLRRINDLESLLDFEETIAYIL